MYWGSVRFFKHLILACFFTALALAVILPVVFGWRYSVIKGKYNELLPETQQLREKDKRYDIAVEALKEGLPELFSELCQQEGITPEQLLSAVNAYPRKTMAGTDGVAVPETPDYTKLYPNLYVEPPTKAQYQENTVYLTFDDGPSSNTKKVLDVLKEQGVKATFFVCPNKDGSDKALLKRIVDEGHTIGVHSLTHEYKTIYNDVPSFLKDFDAASNLIEEATGVKPDIFRFPGGSINNFNRLIYRQLITEMTRRGYTYFDWSADGGEMEDGATSKSISTTVIKQVSGKQRAIVLLHDGGGHKASAEAVERIILGLKEEGYQFDRLSNTVRPVVFGYTLD